MEYLNLYPDMSRKQYETNDTFIYAAPIRPEIWLALRKHARETPQGVRYLLPWDVPELESVIILRGGNDTDDEALTAQAYIRMVHQCRARIYVTPSKKLTANEFVTYAAGAPRELCSMVTLDLSTKEAPENDDVKII